MTRLIVVIVLSAIASSVLTALAVAAHDAPGGADRAGVPAGAEASPARVALRHRDSPDNAATPGTPRAPGNLPSVFAPSQTPRIDPPTRMPGEPADVQAPSASDADIALSAVAEIVEALRHDEKQIVSRVSNQLRELGRELIRLSRAQGDPAPSDDVRQAAIRILAEARSMEIFYPLLDDIGTLRPGADPDSTNFEDYPAASALTHYGAQSIPAILMHVRATRAESVSDAGIALYGIVLTQLAEQMPDEEARALRDRIVADGIAAERGSNQWRLMEWVQLHW